MALSIVLMVVTVVGWGVGAGMEFMFLAFTDYCPPEHCSAEHAAASVVISVLVAAACVLIGCIATIIRLVRRRSGWPFAVATLATSAVAELLGVVGYFAAVGH
ncbi:hypothetical protein [Mycobacterium sp. Aquia_213]|uniref:hypothetical protein n=1 Tax=Mycobacterium sp. Aquia_213 TaxID=2991728 RepID=UPI00226F8B5F|nr:hypothetical protein [Mycobacterium sp. Aquia_213]WAC90044.1 hypothetical protein LMQ14_19185 [Mycobacterium sp. Aquia_213]